MWCDFLSRNYFLKSLYNEMPELKNVRIEEISIHEEGQMVTITFDMPYYADNPPKKWKELEDNVVLVSLDFFQLQEISITANSSYYRGDIDIYKDESELIVVKINGTVNALLKAECGLIQTVTTYLKEES